MLSQAHKFAAAGVLVVKNANAVQYAVSQPAIIAHYLRLLFWPTAVHASTTAGRCPTRPGQVIPPLLLIVALVTITFWATVRWPAWSFVAAWFFLILAPTSSVLPLRDLAFEHRMYLPLAAVVDGVVIGGYVLGQRVVG